MKLLKSLRSLRKVLYNKDFYFVLLVYPLGAFAFVYAKNVLKTRELITQHTKELYSVYSVVILTFLVFYTVYELIDKKLLYKKQGDKLKLKQGEKDWNRQK